MTNLSRIAEILTKKRWHIEWSMSSLSLVTLICER